MSRTDRILYILAALIALLALSFFVVLPPESLKARVIYRGF